MQQKTTVLRKFISIVVITLFSISASAQIFNSANGTTLENAQGVGEPGNGNGQVRVKNSPGVPNNLNNAKAAYQAAGIPNNIINNPRFLGNGAFNREISDMWATKQTAKNVRKVTSRGANPPAASGSVTYISGTGQLNANRTAISSNATRTFVFTGWTNVGWPILVGANTTIWVDGTLNYNGADAPRTATGAAFTPRPSKYDGVFNIRPFGNFRDEPTSQANKNHNNGILNARFRGANQGPNRVWNVKVYGTRRGQLLVTQGSLKDPSNQTLPKVNGITVMNAGNIVIEGVTIKNSFQGVFLSGAFNASVKNCFIDNTLYRALHLKGLANASNGNFGTIANNLLTNSKYDGIDIDSFTSGLDVKENVVIGARDRLLYWTEIDSHNNIINNNVGIMLNAALEGNPIGNAGRGAYQENGTEASRRGQSGFNGNRNNQWINNHSFYAENTFDGFVMRKNRFIQFNTITFRNNYVWSTKRNIQKHNPKRGVTNDVYYLFKQGGGNNNPPPSGGNAGAGNNGGGAPVGSVISFRKKGGDKQYVTTDLNASKNLIARGGTAAPTQSWKTWERFRVQNHPQGGTALVALASNQFVRVSNLDQNVPVRGDGGPGSYSRFKWVNGTSNNEFGLQSIHSGKWVQAPWTQNNVTLFPRGGAFNTWETFVYINNPSAKLLNGDGSTKIEVSPNPVNLGGNINVSMNISDGSASLAVYSLAGQTVYELTESNLEDGPATLTIPADFGSGIYLIQASTGGKISTSKIMIK